MKKRLSFTTKNVVRSFSETTGLPQSRLSVDRDVRPSTKRCELIVSHPVIFENVTIYRDQEALDEDAARHLPCDDFYGFFDVGNLSDEDIIRHASKGCVLSDLRHWIISEGRDQQLSKSQIDTRLKHPLETLIEHYRDDNMEGAFSTLVRQCRSNHTNMSRHLVKAAGGAQKIWPDELYEQLPGGFIARLMLDEDISTFRLLPATIKNKKHSSTP